MISLQLQLQTIQKPKTVNVDAQSVGSNVLQWKRRKKTFVHARKPQDAKSVKRLNVSDRMRKINCDANDEQNVTNHVAPALSMQTRPHASIVLLQPLYNPTLIHAQLIGMPMVETLAALLKTRHLLGFAASHPHLRYLHLFNLLYWIYLLLNQPPKLPRMINHAMTKAQLVSFAVAIARNVSPVALKQRKTARDASARNCVDVKRNSPSVIVKAEAEGMGEATKPTTVLDMKDLKRRKPGMAELLEVKQEEESRGGSRKSLGCRYDNGRLARHNFKEQKRHIIDSIGNLNFVNRMIREDIDRVTNCIFVNKSQRGRRRVHRDKLWWYTLSLSHRIFAILYLCPRKTVASDRGRMLSVWF
jgi:hypothetical protein